MNILTSTVNTIIQESNKVIKLSFNHIALKWNLEEHNNFQDNCFYGD